MDKLTRQEHFDKLKTLIEGIEKKVGVGRQGILDAAFPNEAERKKIKGKYWDLISGHKGINNAEYFYIKIKETYSRVLEIDAIAPIDKTEKEMLLEINAKLDILLNKLNI